jgi:benzoyl-CoA 2,3-dioxygenase component A
MDCISPCPTGSIDNWRVVPAARAYSLEEQMGWTELPAQADLGEAAAAILEASEADISALLAEAHAGAGGKAVAPRSAAKPSINLFTRAKAATATVQGNFRITAPDAESDVRHIVLGFGDTPMPALEGQSIGIVPPAISPDGKEHPIRLYSIASARDGEKRGANNIALTVKRVPGGLVSDWLCGLKPGDKVHVTGPFGATFLMPDDANADIVMICTGTGSAPFRAFTERRRRAAPGAPGKLLMFFGARTPGELPYFGPLAKVPKSLLDQELVYSRLPNSAKEYVQDRMRRRAGDLATILRRDTAHVFICGLRGMEAGVDSAFADICAEGGLGDWAALRDRMRAEGRFHVETY